jgi:hypothetical protein
MRVDHWKRLAVEADEMADWERSMGRYDGAWRNKAVMYRDAAKAATIGTETGTEHCVCCLKPLSGRNYWERGS